ncbi:MAG TPA: hypothetical protein VH643_00700 [Gemmataceae bacterium]|jgi:uncharacterized protein YwgA
MDRQQIGLKLTLDTLGVPARVNSFSNRLVLQKAVYLAQAAGVQLGYQYNWYLRGPYSPALTRDAFAIVAELDQGANDSEGWNLDPTSKQRLSQMKKILEGLQDSELPKKLELLASVHFLLQTRTLGNKDVAELRAVLSRYGKNFSEEDIQQAVVELTQHGLCPGNSSI